MLRFLDLLRWEYLTDSHSVYSFPDSLTYLNWELNIRPYLYPLFLSIFKIPIAIMAIQIFLLYWGYFFLLRTIQKNFYSFFILISLFLIYANISPFLYTLFALTEILTLFLVAIILFSIFSKSSKKDYLILFFLALLSVLKPVFLIFFFLPIILFNLS